MRTPWDSWTTAWKGGLALAETWAASAEVIAARSGIIATGMTTPASADWREINRMVPEKVEAFGLAGATAMIDIARLHADALGVWAAMMGMASAGRPPTIRQTGALLNRVAAGQARAAGASRRALRPIHRAAVANAKRLRG